MDAIAIGETLLGNQAKYADEIACDDGRTVQTHLDDIPFKFGIDSDGNYGYIKEGADTVTPFNGSRNVNTIFAIGCNLFGNHTGIITKTYNVSQDGKLFMMFYAYIVNANYTSQIKTTLSVNGTEIFSIIGETTGYIDEIKVKSGDVVSVYITSPNNYGLDVVGLY